MSEQPIVFIGPSNIGDALLCLPALRRTLARHGDTPGVLLLGPRAFAALGGLLPNLSVSPLERPKKLAQWLGVAAQIRALRPRLVVDFRRSAILPLVTPWRWRAWATALSSLRPRGHDRHAGQDYLALAGLPALPTAQLSPADFGLVIPPSTLAAMQEKLGPLLHKPLVVLQLGASHPPKRYPVGHWLTLATAFEEKGFAVAWAGQAAEDERPRPAPPGQPDFINQTSFDELAALLKLSRLVVSNDSGPMHLAAALGVPVMGLFGQTSAARYGPFAPWGEGLQSPSPCSPCNVAVCRFGQPFCLEELKPGEVLAASQHITSPP